MLRPSPLALVLLVLLVAGCGSVREPTEPRLRTTSFREHVEPLLEKRCIRCHGRTQRLGRYNLSSYRDLLGPGSDERRNAIAGDEQSLFLVKLREAEHWGYLLPDAAELAPGESADARRGRDLDRLRTWIVRDRLTFSNAIVHPPSWSYPGDRASEEFHGGQLRKLGWNLDACRGCHGEDLRGGTSGRSCRTCHSRGPEACSVCHGSADRRSPDADAPPNDLSWNIVRSSSGVGAHQQHTGLRTWATVRCAACHKVPQKNEEAGHLFDQATGKSDLKAEVVFGDQAVKGGVSATYDRATGTCTVYCHGAAFAQNGQGARPIWTASTPAACGSCHNVPARFGGPDCTTCHPQSVTPCKPDSADPECLPTGTKIGVRFINRELHGDGKYPLGRAGEEDTCYGCHGTKASDAPAPDLHGRTDIGTVTVGLHQAHLGGTKFTAKPIPCESCHAVPKEVQDKGHFDDDLPAEVSWSDLVKGQLRASGVDLKPAWDRATARCQNTFCHSLDGGSVTEWKWTKAQTLECDSCHGSPPLRLLNGEPHSASSSCQSQSCHSTAYTAGGELDKQKHINGKVDL